jgi:hypothetical protein
VGVEERKTWLLYLPFTKKWKQWKREQEWAGGLGEKGIQKSNFLLKKSFKGP